jgi:pimeloyl-ACP methyl ester carboxylesterase
MNGRRLAWIALIVVVLGGLIVSLLGTERALKPGARQLRRVWLIVTGHLIDVGGYRLRIERAGHGTPTVVMDAGLCQIMRSWDRVAPEVAKFTGVVTYNRASLGGSDAGPIPRTSQQNVDELQKLLKKAGVPGPYVLVGHSFGGLNIRLYASQHPDQVVGLVFIDASHEEQYAHFAALKSSEERERYLRHESGDNCENVNLLESGRLVHKASAILAVPVVVLTADPYHRRDSTVDAKWAEVQTEMQSRLAGLIPNSKHIIVEKSGHFIQLDQPDLVIDVIRTVVESVRRQLAGQSPTTSNDSGRHVADRTGPN